MSEPTFEETAKAKTASRELGHGMDINGLEIGSIVLYEFDPTTSAREDYGSLGAFRCSYEPDPQVNVKPR